MMAGRPAALQNHSARGGFVDILEHVRIPDYAIGPGEHSPAEIDDADVLTGIIAGEPVLMLLVRFRVAQITADGVLVSGDALESAVRARGRGR